MERIFGPLARVTSQEHQDLQYPNCEGEVPGADPVTEGVPTPVAALQADTLDKATVTDWSEDLIEWIFAQHPREGRAPAEKNDLHDRAVNSGAFPGLTGVQFTAAYQQVYQTDKHRPPKGGWPLHGEFARRLEAQK